MIHSFPLDRAAIMAVLPHRDPMLFIDRVAEAASTYVDPNWTIFQGHFPEFPIMPGVLLIETVAQAGSLILGLKDAVAEGSFIGFTGVEAAKFRKAVLPGDMMHIFVELVRERRGFYKFEGRITVGEDLVAEVKFAAAKLRLSTPMPN